MRIINIFYFLSIFLPSCATAKVKLLLTPPTEELINEHRTLLNLFQPLVQNNESEVLEKFIKKEANVAIVRGDILYHFFSNKKILYNTYSIIGKLSEKSVIYFLTKPNARIKTIKNMNGKVFSIGMLGDLTNQYLKNILNKENISYSINTKSEDFRLSLQYLKNNKIDGMFIFGRKKYNQSYVEYMQKYPENFILSLKEEKGLVCEKNSCSTEYYLIVSNNVGKQVMHNIYNRVSPILSKNKKLTVNLGQYYIDIKKNKSSSIDISPRFGRTPWMDIAIKEAIVGKGRAENILPMLDLAYKYIRFSKGTQGITTAPNDSKVGSWCAAYVCWTLSKSGFKVHKKGRMASQSFRYFKDKLYKKIDKPIFGAIALYTSKENPLYGHVGYLFGHTKYGNNILLGGNQNNRLKFASYPPQGFGNYRFNGFYIPKDYIIQKKDQLTKKDIYKSVKLLNQRYGIQKSAQSKNVK